jgi:putative effector of murein hydrolase LrgA (UPF0299 family)
MRRWQNGLVILAAFLVAGALLPWNLRLVCSLGAIGIVLLLFVLRLRAHGVRSDSAGTAATLDRIARIRAEREQRMGRKGR